MLVHGAELPNNGYFILIAGRPKVNTEKNKRTTDTLPGISVVIPIRNEERFIAQTIGYMQNQDYPHEKLEILVVDGESNDNTVAIVEEIAAQDPRVKLFHNPRRLSSAARNVGAHNATGDIVTYVDGHTYIDNDQLLRNIASTMAEQEIVVLSRPQFLETPENNRYQQAVALARRSIIGHGIDSTIYTDRDLRVDPTSSGASYKKEVFSNVGYFDETFDACEDVDFNYRVSQSGFESYTSLKLAVYYYPRDSFSGLFQQMKRYGVGRFRLARKHPGTLSLGTLIPFLLTVGLPLLAILSIFHIYFLALFVFSAGIYAGLILAASTIVAGRRGWSYLTLLPSIYLAIHVGLGYGFLAEMLRTLVGKGPKISRWKAGKNHDPAQGRDD